ncbi:hypothetical protein LC607_01305 [Nostoc sp. CHAB 5824]|nr:hypothetical protein [Nostoc sp. CHAB 5824]
MEIKEILQALPSLSISDRLKIAESALQLVLQEKHSFTKDEQKRQLTLAAMTAITDYAPGSELNIFSNLEGKLKRQEELLYIIPQSLIEFWAVATRPINSNGLGLSTAQAVEETDKVKKIFILNLDILAIFSEWESLIFKYQVMEKKVHDARLVAAMITHKITHLLTFNIDDFKHFSAIVIVDPRSVTPQS